MKTMEQTSSIDNLIISLDSCNQTKGGMKGPKICAAEWAICIIVHYVNQFAVYTVL